ncbi:molybdate ABC transporter substrate-binding protein [Geobacter sp. AOG1]|uniref:molybdate ABC transporter substrate-binding protein n=1 Tax=Geobacter sp. AOG1 TaxID=1566346 RepID=UPI001CC80929|nr:molybdate ABC transporter substrate-binding protein [Geobacter sp. AOG1]GFE58031.1 molybdate ABC transporter substrate-binding protein [Geobacter sp. AOG1]
MKRAVLAGVLCFALAVLPGMAAAGEISLFAAASLKEVLNELGDGYTRTHTGVKILRNFGGSGALAMQTENGAPADIFISASQDWLDYLDGKKLIDKASIGIFARNVLVFVGDGHVKVNGMQDLPKLKRIAIGSPKSVPAGEYAMKALEHAFLAPQLTNRLVMAKDVRACLMYAERGEVDGAFVYKTDALLAKRAHIMFTVPQGLYPPVTYPMGLTPAGAQKKDAVAFYRYLQSASARKVLARYGFILGQE